MQMETRIYSSKDVAKRLKIEAVTVRKYSQMLEEYGYRFQRDKKGWRRQYAENDICALEYIRNMKAMGKSLDESIQQVASLRSNLSISVSDDSLRTDSPWEAFLKKQEEFNQKILDRLDVQGRILEAQKRRQADRDQILIEFIRETLEAPKQAAAASEKKWWKFWK